LKAGPKPRLTERTHKKDWHKIWQQLSDKERWKKAEEIDWIITENEPLFDASDVVRCGMDLFLEYSMVTNDGGICWLRAHFPNHRVYKIRYKELQAWHKGSTLVLARPELVVCDPAT